MIVKTEGGVSMIWCVEDDSSIRDIEVYALASTGFEAKGFEDGDAFWNALQSEKPVEVNAYTSISRMLESSSTHQIIATPPSVSTIIAI